MRVAVLGATGLVGRTMLRLLEDRAWVEGEPVALASARGAGAVLDWRGRRLVCREVGSEAFEGIDLALFSAGGAPSRRWAPVAAAAGAVVVDNSSAWRQEAAIPLVVPEINGELVTGLRAGIVANPNCSTIQVALAVAPLERAWGLAEVHVATYQAVSGAGQKGVDELRRQERDEPSVGVFPRPIARNVIPAIGAALPDGSYEEEAKVVRELRKILGRGEDLKVTCTAVRVPVLNGHSAAVRAVCRVPVTPPAARAAMADWAGLEVAADGGDYATPREVDGRTVVHVGRLRQDPGEPRGLLCWVVADNLLKGAAWNAVQIAALVAGGSA
ncbi:aspartate-semialdehyde dehydrogenase [bacterium]|nr:aspartate-semialdehyde dehydrogenase [bacterium]